VISRRTRIAFEAKNNGVHLAQTIAEIITPVLGWSAKERKSSIAAYETSVEREVVALAAMFKSSEKVSS